MGRKAKKSIQNNKPVNMDKEKFDNAKQFLIGEIEKAFSEGVSPGEKVSFELPEREIVIEDNAIKISIKIICQVKVLDGNNDIGYEFKNIYTCGLGNRNMCLYMSEELDSVEEAVNHSIEVFETYKFNKLAGSLCSKEETKKIETMNILYPIKQSICSVCLEPTFGKSICNHNICMICKYKILKQEHSPCPICRKCLCCGRDKDCGEEEEEED
jgi:hypothetical protein